jgi:AraC-like DNA-binding protein
LGNVSLDVAGKDSVFILHTSLKEKNIYVFTFYLFMLSCFYKFFSWLIDESLCPTKISIAHPRIVENDVISEILDCQVEFNAAHNAIYFNNKLLSRPIVRTNRELEEIIKVSLFEFMPVPAVGSIAVYLEKLIKKMLRENVRIPGVDAIASQLGRSGQTLRRHLAQEKVSFQYILDKCRLERAQELLFSSNMTIDEISAGMGFSAPSGFSRAFKSWTGYAPSLYRQLSVAEQDQTERCRELVCSEDFAVDDESYT